MSKRLFVANIPFTASEDDLTEVFKENGLAVHSARIIFDRETDRSKGYGFVELANEKDVAVAVELNQQVYIGNRALVIRVAEDRPPQNPRGGSSSGGPPPRSNRGSGW